MFKYTPTEVRMTYSIMFDILKISTD
ncbi:hypothetical protein MADA3029_760013 [Vibrio nigripulchritudo MADA3029]|uniref:Uncharacterized protein n=1 Tax=Vibrio nigripulchritudo TaxID=28173 RepID=U4KIG6_9VIBR|nr:hypothetical protein VIBNIAM115_1470017 [Vibrio nigripulchritudo AM115]CCN39150.1 hypothetical protein VIBNIFTn2_1000017 [Vibrio nigripulchritudo FTn2]CCN48958.1 hypothetical protein VIBNIMADA3020_670013 [Vibrio nigripulchritudo MADA3020]CCN55272.1 hypothetical protein VIBNIMADA3021_730013 [Vibrio nigripulchritudo MADA3021]CCN61415.1 hypothetical protein MADA3029_760013 [Vibrio nigripulchritudo MADA3029]CCN70788.1 hypothetical protein VIBNISFn118_260017 [Vibrio nigripulchritudo SFn118]CCN8